MKIYASLFAYLNQSQLITDNPRLEASQRPIIVLEPEENLSTPSWLIPFADRVYEIGFPYLKRTDLEPDKFDLEFTFNLDVSEKSYSLSVRDEVLDLETIKEESEIQEWENRLQNRLDQRTSELIRLFIGMLTEIFSNQKTVNSKIILIEIPKKLELIKTEDAKLPIVISLDRKYKLRRQLELISNKLRHQLRRQAELISVGRIQEMDSYCLRDYVRRPGLTAVEKAGSKQELMGIQRYQDFNTPENKFLVYFSQLLHLNCFQYERNGASQFRDEIRKVRLVIDLFKEQPIVKTIQDRTYQFTKPNYILQQNPIYRSFYQAYLDYLQKRYEKERLWTFRNILLADNFYICLTAALLKFQGISVDANLAITGNLTPDKGRYLQQGENITVNVFLQNQVYVFSLKKSIHEIKSDWILTLEIHQLDSINLETKKLVFPIWVFWYCPDNSVIAETQKYLQDLINNQNVKIGLIFYLQVSPGQSSSTARIKLFCERKLWLIPLPDPIASHGFGNMVDWMTILIKEIVEFPI